MQKERKHFDFTVFCYLQRTNKHRCVPLPTNSGLPYIILQGEAFNDSKLSLFTFGGIAQLVYAVIPLYNITCTFTFLGQNQAHILYVLLPLSPCTQLVPSFNLSSLLYLCFIFVLSSCIFRPVSLVPVSCSRLLRIS